MIFPVVDSRAISKTKQIQEPGRRLLMRSVGGSLRWSSQTLCGILKTPVLRLVDLTWFLLEVILSAVDKCPIFPLYGLIDSAHSTLASTVVSNADAVTHIGFEGTG